MLHHFRNRSNELHMFELISSGIIKWQSLGPNNLNYIRIGYNTEYNNDIEFVDPSGGPFIHCRL